MISIYDQYDQDQHHEPKWEIFTNQDNWQKGICLTRGWRNLARRQICKIFSSNISDSPPNLSIEFNQKDENLSKFQHKGKPSKPRVYSHRLKPFLVNSQKIRCWYFELCHFQFCPSPFWWLPAKRKFWKHLVSPPSAISFHHLASQAETFQKLSGCDCNKRSKRKGWCRWLNG